MGLTDGVDTERILAAWSTIRALGADTPAESNGKPDEKASDKQRALIRDLCKRKALVAPDDNTPLTKAQASEIIDSIDGGTYDPAKWTVPF
jgi:hypothetical protein